MQTFTDTDQTNFDIAINDTLALLAVDGEPWPHFVGMQKDIIEIQGGPSSGDILHSATIVYMTVG